MAVKEFFQNLFSSQPEETSKVDTPTEEVSASKEEDKSGFIYIISNIGSFGKDVYKIGMTKAKDPLNRIKSLSDASVPFSFAVHAIIPTSNAGETEAQFHRFLREYEINRVNHRKEFFKVSLDKIKDVTKKLGYKVTWDDDAVDINYLKSLAKNEAT